jgi:hypothetical protein
MGKVSGVGSNPCFLGQSCKILTAMGQKTKNSCTCTLHGHHSMHFRLPTTSDGIPVRCFVGMRLGGDGPEFGKNGTCVGLEKGGDITGGSAWIGMLLALLGNIVIK